MVRQSLRVLVFTPLVFLLLLVCLGGFLGPLFLFSCAFGLIISLFLSAASLMALIDIKPAKPPVTPEPEQPTLPSGLPWVPKNLAQLRAAMDDKQFEYFSAALIIAMGEGHRFHSRVGGAGDWGVDTKLLNLHNCIVVVQSKFYAHDNHVKPTEVRDFHGSLSFHNAVYGFFVTTSEFSKQAKDTIHATRGRIRAINGRQIEALLQHRQREIALALRDVQIATAPVE